jgi:predicted metal-dependent TIM-barrel fold hydrolase
MPCLVHFFSQSSNFDPCKYHRTHVNEWLVAEYIVYSKDWTNRKAIVEHVENLTGGKISNAEYIIYNTVYPAKVSRA